MRANPLSGKPSLCRMKGMRSLGARQDPNETLARKLSLRRVRNHPVAREKVPNETWAHLPRLAPAALLSPLHPFYVSIVRLSKFLNAEEVAPYVQRVNGVSAGFPYRVAFPPPPVLGFDRTPVQVLERRGSDTVRTAC